MKVLLMFSFLVQFEIAFTQNIEITVLNKHSQPMPYAYILINQKPIAICDNLGVAVIPQNRLADNDTISVSFIGASPATLIFDKSLRQSKKYTFMLEDAIYMLGEAVVEYHDIEKLFKRSNNSLPQLNYNCRMNANFKASIKIPGKKPFLIDGSLEAENEVWSKKFTYRAYGWFHHPIKFTTDNDTAKLTRMLSYHTHFAINNIYKALEYSRTQVLDHYKPFYSYLGKIDKNKVFRITYPETTIMHYPFQIILYLDEKTKNINSVDLQAVDLGSDKNNSSYKFTLKCDCEVYFHKKPLMNKVYLASDIVYSFETESGFRIDIEITYPTIKVKRF